MASNLTFLKLGGSLITIKDQRSTVNFPVLRSACEQIARFVDQNKKQPLLLGHGSGSFGHFAAKKYDTLNGIYRSDAQMDESVYWQGFFEVYRQAHTLNAVVMDELQAAGVPAISFSPVSAVTTENRSVREWNMEPILAALDHGMVPVVFGDVIFDRAIGGTILSTENFFDHLAEKCLPTRVLLAGIEEGVWEDYPNNQHLITEINSSNFPQIAAALRGSASVDVTGGMDTKVAQTLELTSRVSGLQARIFSGIPKENIFNALIGQPLGTLLQN